MRFGLFYLPSFDLDVHRDAQTLFAQIIEQVELAEALGLDSAWVAEHHFTAYGGDIPNPPVLLSALAQRTKRIRLGTSGVALPLNRPLNTAEQLAMVDALSGGRLDIGVVRGFLNFEFEALNVEMAESRERFNEGLEIIRGTFANERFSFSGKYNQFADVELRPRPVQRHPAIFVGSVASEETLVYAGTHGLNLMVIPYAVSPEAVKKQVAVYHDALREAGHDPENHRVMGAYHMYMDDDLERAKDTAREPMLRYLGYIRDAVSDDRWSGDYESYRGMVKMIEALMDFEIICDRRSLFGDARRIHEGLASAREIGITDVSLVTIMPGLAQDKILASMRLFAEKVIPKYR